MSPEPAQAVPRTCARCGARFGCGAGSGNCWCEGVTLAPEAAAALRAGYEDCLCPACLADPLPAAKPDS